VTDIVAQMKAEEAALVRKLDAVRQFLAAYGEGAATRGASAPRSPRAAAERVDKFGSYGKGVISAAMECLPSEGDEPISTRELVDRLELRGVEIRGQNKVNALSALLARSSQIKGHGRAGWTRKQQDEFEALKGDAPPKENEAPSGEATGASEPSGWDVASTPTASINPQTRPVA
jgi:hypothetical protein